MSLQNANISEMKYYGNQIKKAKASFDESLKILRQTINFTKYSWQGQDAENFRDNVTSIINKNLSMISKEFELEIKYLEKVSSVLENAQDQVKKRLNS